MEPNNNTGQSKYDYRDYPPMNSGFGSEFEKSTPSQSFHHQNNDSIQRYNNGGGFAEPIRPFPFIAEQFPPTEYRANGPSFIWSSNEGRKKTDYEESHEQKVLT